MADDFGDRLKQYEDKSRLFSRIPVIARLDGKSFHTLTGGLQKPYDERLLNLMIDTARHLLVFSNANIAYTQSDEITLAWLSVDPKVQIYLDGRVQKMSSILASICTEYFNRQKGDLFGPAMFDCRVYNVPTLDEGVNIFKWREQDATKNSIASAAQSVYSPRELLNKKQSQQQEMLFQKGINWNNYPSKYKRGTYIQKTKNLRPFDLKEIEKLPPKHKARTNPDLKILRTDYRILDISIFKVENPEEVLFFGADPR